MQLLSQLLLQLWLQYASRWRLCSCFGCGSAWPDDKGQLRICAVYAAQRTNWTEPKMLCHVILAKGVWGQLDLRFGLSQVRSRGGPGSGGALGQGPWQEGLGAPDRGPCNCFSQHRQSALTSIHAHVKHAAVITTLVQACSELHWHQDLLKYACAAMPEPAQSYARCPGLLVTA